MAEFISGHALSGHTRLAAVIGHPVRHSLSPALHNAAFGHLGLDWAYLAFEVPPGGGAGAVAAMRTLGIDGLSVTMPHKDDVAAACDELSPQARLLGAVNCVARHAEDRDVLVGHNTDGAGFVRSLQGHLKHDLDNCDAVVVGAGGAARAVIVALMAEGASVAVVNRSPDAAEQAVDMAMDTDLPGEAWVACDLEREVAQSQLIVNATPLGMKPDDPLPLPQGIFDNELIAYGKLAVDLIYRPAATPLLQLAADTGASTLNGVGMLLFQAAEQFELWTGHPAPVEAMAAAVGLELPASATQD